MLRLRIAMNDKPKAFIRHHLRKFDQQQTKAVTTAVPKISTGLADMFPPLQVNALVAHATAVPKVSRGLADMFPPLHVNALVAQPENALAGVPPLLMQLPLKVWPPLVQGSQAVRIVLGGGIKRALRIQPGTLQHGCSVITKIDTALILTSVAKEDSSQHDLMSLQSSGNHPAALHVSDLHKPAWQEFHDCDHQGCKRASSGSVCR